MNFKRFLAGLMSFSLVAMCVAPLAHAELPDPDGEYADESKPVQVFLIMGQSNTLEMGKVKGGNEGSLENAVKNKNLYPYLVDEEGNWLSRKDVRNVSVMHKRGNMNVYRNEWLTVAGKGKIGIEIGIGNHVGHAVDAPVMILKSSIGNRSLGWDLLPPGAERYEYKGKMYPGYRDEVRHSSWDKGNIPDPPGHGWYAGKQYDDDVANAKKVLAEIEKYYPGGKEVQVAGFFWWQGDKDRYNEGHAQRYEKNLVHLIKALRKEFNAPKAPFVIATLGQTQKGAGGNEGMILQGMMNVADGEKYPEFNGNVTTVYTHPVSKGSSSNAHYGGNAETYMNVGELMGKAMVGMLED